MAGDSSVVGMGDIPGGALGDYFGDAAGLPMADPSEAALDEEKDAVKVCYLTSSQHQGAVVHFYQTVEAAQQGIDNVHRQRRTFGLVDPYDYSADIHVGVTRCVMVSKIEEITLPPSEMRVLLGPFTEFDVLCQGSSMLDFIRTIGALYSPQAPGNPMILLQVDDRQQKYFYNGKNSSSATLKSVRCNVFKGRLESLRPKKAKVEEEFRFQQPAPPVGAPPPQTQQTHQAANQQGWAKQQAQQQDDLRMQVQHLQEELHTKGRGHDISETEMRREIVALREELRKAASPPRVEQPSPLFAANPPPQQQQPHQQPQQNALWAQPQAQPIQTQPPPPSGPPPVWLEPYKLPQTNRAPLFDSGGGGGGGGGVAKPMDSGGPQFLLGGSAMNTPGAEMRHVSPFNHSRGGGGGVGSASGNAPPGQVLQGQYTVQQQQQPHPQQPQPQTGPAPIYPGTPQTPGSIWGF